MAVTTKEPLGAVTLNRKWYVDVNSGTYSSPVWVGIFGVEEFSAPKEPTLQDNSDFDSAWKSEAVTALKWSIDMKVARKTPVADATTYDPGQELLRAASDEVGADNRVDIRWYEYKGEAGGPQVEAYRGYASVTWTPDGGKMDDLDTVTVALTGQGARTAITHPATAAIPALYAVSPATDVEAGGALVKITGVGFTGTLTADGVIFGAVSSADYIVENDHTIYAVAPAQSAGVVAVTVTNATGVSTVSNPSFTYTAA